VKHTAAAAAATRDRELLSLRGTFIIVIAPPQTIDYFVVVF
jgi:hypothetical protein